MAAKPLRGRKPTAREAWIKIKGATPVYVVASPGLRQDLRLTLLETAVARRKIDPEELEHPISKASAAALLHVLKGRRMRP